MDYKKLYDEALERARKIHDEIVNNEVIGFPGQITDIFPELREPEDERMLKKIIDYLEMIKMGCVICTIDTSEEIAWLKKQKETLHIPETCKENADSLTDTSASTMIPSCWAQCDDNRFWIIDRAKKDILEKTNIESSPEEMKVLDNILFRAWQMGWLSKYDVIVPEQKPAEWSEEDERVIGRLRSVVNQLASYTDSLDVNGDYCEGDYAKLDAWLKSLRPQKKEDLAKMLQDEYEKGREYGERIGHTKGFNKGYKVAEEEYRNATAYKYPVPPSGIWCDGTHCTNPHHDCVNCPTRYSSSGTITTPNSATIVDLPKED